jgi:hypothetical protein
LGLKAEVWWLKSAVAALPRRGNVLALEKKGGGARMNEESAGQISEEEFVFRAIKRLRKPPYRGIHSVYSGFNQAFKEHFGKNPVETTQKMAGEGKIAIRPVRGGMMLYLPDEVPQAQKSVLQKILGPEEESA